MLRMGFHILWLTLITFQLGYAENKVLSSDAIAEKKREEIRKLVEEKKLELNGTDWKVEVKSQTGKGALLGPDELTFQDGKFSSKTASKNGYNQTNYTLTPSQTGSTTWETMQTNQDGEVTFWRGEWKEDSMSGVISRQLKEGNEDYYFSSSNMDRISPTSSEEGEAEKSTSESSEANVEKSNAQEQVQSSKVTPPAQEKTKAEKRSWFF